MDPISTGLGILGVGMKIFGGLSSMNDSEQINEINGQIQGQERELNKQRHNAMLLSSQRQQLEIIRNYQRARAMALNNASSQGAQYGSGLAGGYGQISGQTNTNLNGVSQNLELGENMFTINNTISGLKQQVSNYQTDMNTNQGIASLGGTFMQGGQVASNLFKNFGSTGSSGGGMFFNGPWSLGS